MNLVNHEGYSMKPTLLSSKIILDYKYSKTNPINPQLKSLATLKEPKSHNRFIKKQPLPSTYTYAHNEPQEQYGH